MGDNTNHKANSVAQSYAWGEHSFSNTGSFDFLLHHFRPKREMYTKVIVWMFLGVGLPSYLLSWLDVLGWIDITGAKAFILFTLAVLTFVSRLVVYCVENYQKYVFRKRKLKNMK